MGKFKFEDAERNFFTEHRKGACIYSFFAHIPVYFLITEVLFKSEKISLSSTLFFRCTCICHISIFIG